MRRDARSAKGARALIIRDKMTEKEKKKKKGANLARKGAVFPTIRATLYNPHSFSVSTNDNGNDTGGLYTIRRVSYSYVILCTYIHDF